MKPIKWVAAWLICAAALAMAGCAPGADGMRQAIANTASAVASGYRALGEADAQVQARVRVQAKADPKAAQAALDEHLKRYAIAQKALDAASAVVETANISVPLVERGIARDKDAAGWIADLVAAALSVTKALHELGVY